MTESIDYKFFFDTTRSACFIINTEGILLSSNHAAKRHSLNAGQNLLTLILPSEIPKLTKEIESFKTSKNEGSKQLELFSFPETFTRTRWQINLMPKSKNIAFICEELSAFTAEDFLLHTGLMKKIFDEDPNLIVIVNRAGHLLFANKAVYKFAGISSEVPQIDTLNNMVENSDLWLPGHNKTRVVLDSENSDVQLITDHLGNSIWFENIRTVLSLPFGEKVDLIISKNVTNWKLSEKRLIDHQLSLYHTTRISFVREIIGLINKDINTLLISNKKESHNYHKKLKELINESSKVFKMLRHLIKENNSTPATTFKLVPLVSSVISTLNDKLHAYEIDYKQNNNDLDHLEISGHSAEISQVFLNLMLNAINSVLLNKKDTKRQIEIHFTKKGKSLFISIIYNGAGLKKEIQNKSFESKFTLKSISNFEDLGLFITKKTIEHHKGELTFEHSKGKTKFIVKLPRKLSSPG